MITFNLFESNLWDSFCETYVLKNLNKLYFVLSNKKVGKFSFFIFNFFTFEIRKNVKAKFP